MSIVILYQISNEFPPNHHQPSSSPRYNAFRIPRPTNGATLSSIKSAHHPVLRHLHPHGSNGYHWRVRIDERPGTSHDSGSHSSSGHSWWDVQDENARLPVRDCSPSELKKLCRPESRRDDGELQEVAKAAKGAMKYVGKAMNAVAGTAEEDSAAEKVSVICFKLLDLRRIGAKRPRVAAAAPRSTPQRTRPVATQAVPTANLMEFHAPTAGTASSTQSAPSQASSLETRAEKLQREYTRKAHTSNRVWDEVDQRWVEGPVRNGEAGGEEVAKSLKGIRLDASNAVGKSESVANAIRDRVAEMQQSQQQAVSELREREAAKASADAEEDAVRIRLEPKLRAWSEEHGRKKQLRALLANLHTILWEDSGWKPISLAEVLEDSKVKRVYHKASRVVHPDKTGGLDAEKRFVAKRVFDALTQAKVEFDSGGAK